MTVLLTGGNEWLQRSLIKALVERQHQVRCLAAETGERPAERHSQVEPWPADFKDPAALQAAANGCEAAIVVRQPSTASAGRAEDDVAGPAEAVIETAGRAGVRRLILVSLPGAQQGEPSGRAEGLARSFPGEWLVVRTAPVYGVTDDPLSLFLILMRSLPAVPILSDTHRLQPLWHEDLAQAVVAGLSLDAAAVNRVVQLTGPETVTQDQLYERLATLTDRRPLRIPVPGFVAAHGATLAAALHLSVPFEASHLAFTAAAEPTPGAPDTDLSTLFGVTATDLATGLTRLVHQLAEVTPSEGVGTLEVKRFSARIHGSRYDAAGLLTQFRTHFNDVMPIPVGVEPVAPHAELVPGKVVTMALPGRGHVQVRVEEVTDTHVVVATLRGHALAGVVKFSTQTFEDGVGFEVMPCDTAANALDWLTLTLGGAKAQDGNWIRVVQNVVKLAGGTADPIQTEARKLAGEEAEQMQRWISDLIQRQRERQDTAESASPRPSTKDEQNDVGELGGGLNKKEG